MNQFNILYCKLYFSAFRKSLHLHDRSCEKWKCISLDRMLNIINCVLLDRDLVVGSHTVGHSVPRPDISH